ncbi:MAG TPA: AAA family ATPase [Parachlamydiaceae bacterium]|nr:AAA family ATPase [Parachlamydiaceae bacterium]
MYLQHFGLKNNPLGKEGKTTVDEEQYQKLKPTLDNLLLTRGVGLVTGESGVGKTRGIRNWINTLNPHTCKIIYQPDTQFGSFCIYRQLAEKLGLELLSRYSTMWRNVKQELSHCYHEKKITPIWILDEAQQLPQKFLADLPLFLNHNCDTEDIMVLLLVGSPRLFHTLQKQAFEPLVSRIQFHFEWEAIEDLGHFKQVLQSAFELAGAQTTLMSETGLQMIHLATKGRLRYANRIITQCLQEAASQNINHIPDDIIKNVIEGLRSITH